MPAQPPHDNQPAGARVPGKQPGEPDPALLASRVLVVHADPAQRTALREAICTLGVRVSCAGAIEECAGALRNGEFDLALLSDAPADRADALGFVSGFARADDHPLRFIVISTRTDLDAPIEAMRSGAIDFIRWPCAPEHLVERTRNGLESARRLRDERRRVERLKRLCKRLNTAREEVTEQVDLLCNDLVSAYQDLADQMSAATLASEFGTLVGQELDVESLLRTTLEFLLSKTGPTNAAVFLPTGSHDYDLGAYVNYDIPRDTADVLLDHLTDILAHRFEDERGLVLLEGEDALTERLGDDASWLESSSMTVFACHADDECLAVVALFRDAKSPFTGEILAQLEVIREIFTEQLAKVVRIHHRHMPGDHWPGFDVEDDSSGGMAA